MGAQEIPFPLRLEKPVMEKMRFLAKENARSINKQIEYSLKKYLDAYEKEHGEITVSKE